MSLKAIAFSTFPKSFSTLVPIAGNRTFSSLTAQRTVKCIEVFKTSVRYGRYRYNYKAWPNNWLPFKWERPEDVPGYFNTGDPVEGLPQFDTHRLRPPFDKIEELKNASEEIKKLFSVGMLKRKQILKSIFEEKKKEFVRHFFDEYSPEVKILKYTLQIRSARYTVRNEHPNQARLKNFINIWYGKRKNLLNHLYKTDRERYERTVNALNIKHTPAPPGVVETPRIERKKELRKLTAEYCERLRNEKLSKYHEQLKEEQVKFLKEKEETERWISETLSKLNLKDPRSE